MSRMQTKSSRTVAKHRKKDAKVEIINAVAKLNRTVTKS